MNFFFDNNISYRIAEALASLVKPQSDIIIHIRNDERFSSKNTLLGSNFTPDEEWITELGKDDVVWNVISGNYSILNHPNQRALLADAKLPFFFPDDNFRNASLFDQARLLIWLWPEIRKAAENPLPGVYEIVTVPRKLRVEPVKFGRKSLSDLRRKLGAHEENLASGAQDENSEGDMASPSTTIETEPPTA